MDPYLEGPGWMPVHTQLLGEIGRQLAPLLPSRYLVRSTERGIVVGPPENEDTPRDIYPDLSVKTRQELSSATQTTQILAAPLRLTTEMPVRIPHTTLEIRDVHDRRVVTAIELLSPTNKTGDGRDEYLAKRRQILLSNTNLIEIDLLRRGQRVPMRQALPAAPYFVLLSRVELRPTLEVWPITLDQPLPTIPVPLLPGDADVPLNVQLALTTMYDTYRYDQDIDYRQPPAIPLEPAMQAWANDLLRRPVGQSPS